MDAVPWQMVLSQATWVLLLLNGMVTAAGFHVHYTVDIVRPPPLPSTCLQQKYLDRRMLLDWKMTQGSHIEP